MNPQHLTDSELSAELTEIRTTLESIRPYHMADLELRRRQLWAEYEKRHPLGQPQGPACACNDDSGYNG